MKRFTRIIGAVCMMGLLTFVSTSCKKNQENDETTLNVVVSGLEEEGERAYINSNLMFMWHEQDYIRVYNLADEANADESTTAVYAKIGNYSGPTARFRGPSVGLKKADGYRYFYPVNMVKGTDDEICMNLWNGNRQDFHVSDHQQFEAYYTPTHHLSLVDGLAMPMAVDVENLYDDVTMQQLFGAASFRMSVGPEYQGEVVVDSIRLIDNYHNISGDFSLKLHKFHFEDYMMAWNQFFAEYQGFTDEYQQEILYPLYYQWGYVENNVGHEITLNCTFQHEDGEVKGVTLQTGFNYTDFAFMLRPLALSEGFQLLVYIEGRTEPIVLTDAEFYRSSHQTLDYTWAVKTGMYKRYLMRYTIDRYLE